MGFNPTTVGPRLLEVNDLHVSAVTARGRTEIVRGVNLHLGRERLAVVGESGSGKSMTFRALLGLVPTNLTVQARRVLLRGERIDQWPPARVRSLRGRRIGMVVQDPRQGFDPIRTIGSQLEEMLRLHGLAPRLGLRARIHELLADVHIREPQRVAEMYPHQVSGGMAQRAMLAMALSAQPDILIADEVTSALDAAVRLRILDLIDEQVRLRGMGLVLISHDLNLAARYADRVTVMYAGRIMEELSCGSGSLNPIHPYTRGLLDCRPSAMHIHRELPVLTRDPAWLT